MKEFVDGYNMIEIKDFTIEKLGVYFLLNNDE